MKPKKGIVPAHLKKYLFKKKSGGQHMAKKYSRVRSTARRVYARARHTARKSYTAAKSAGMGLLDIAFSFGYGWGRSYIVGNDLVKKVVGMIPFGGAYKDNLLLGGGAWLINFILRPTNVYVKKGLATIVNSEAFLAGAKVSMGYSITNDSQAPSATTGGGDYL